VIHVVVGDIASVAADAVVRPANTRLEPITPALRRLEEAAGPRFQEQCRIQWELGVGAAVVTRAGELSVEFVIHAVIGTDESTVTADGVRSAVAAALWQSQQWQMEAVALPPLGQGQLSAQASADAMVPPIVEHLRNADHPATVLIVVTTDQEREIFAARAGPGEPS